MTDVAAFWSELGKELLRQLVPDEISVMGAGARMTQVDAEFFAGYAVVLAAALIGIGASYIAGARMGAPVLARLIGRSRAARLRRGQKQQEYAGWLLSISVWIPVARQLVPFVAGGCRMPLRRFWLFFLPSTFVWTLHSFLMGYWFSDELDALLAGVYAYRNIALGTAVVAAVCYIAIRQYMRMKLWRGARSAKHRGELQKEPTA
ncbi:DedA family protein [Brevibacillus sp. SAFN-007a]|uniref:DedA family protein n=1 Tax=Brevibacillus sp. SAFN-007a TaxID=3436862 RepID=UPI003F7F9115